MQIKYTYHPEEAKKTSTSCMVGPKENQRSISIDWRPGIGYDVTAKKFFLFTGAVRPDEDAPPGAKVVYQGPFYVDISRQQSDGKGGFQSLSERDFKMHHLRHTVPLNNFEDTTPHALAILAPGQSFSKPAEGKAAIQKNLNVIAAILMQNGGGPMTMAEIAAKQQIAQAAIGGRVERVG